MKRTAVMYQNNGNDKISFEFFPPFKTWIKKCGQAPRLNIFASQLIKEEILFISILTFFHFLLPLIYWKWFEFSAPVLLYCDLNNKDNMVYGLLTRLETKLSKQLTVQPNLMYNSCEFCTVGMSDYGVQNCSFRSSFYLSDFWMEDWWKITGK